MTDPGDSSSRRNVQLWGSDPMAETLRLLDFDYIALTPGASFRGLHDSLVNYLGNTKPEMLLCIHEEHAVALAHGFARVTGRPLPVALHSNVGLMHATMAIFNAWCDRIPMLILGAVGPVDATRRRPWVDWIHTAADLGALVRGYTKWDDQPGSVSAAVEAIVRGHRIAVTEPRGPVYVCLDAGLQEDPVDSGFEMPDLARFRPGVPGDPPQQAVRDAAGALANARRPVIMIGRVSSDPVDWERRVRLAERLGAVVLTDMKTGASFPTRHPQHPYASGLFLDAAAYPAIRDADVIVSLDWIDLGGSLRNACGGQWPKATVIHCSMDEYIHNGWSMDYQAMPAVDHAILAPPDRLVSLLLEAVERAAPAALPTREPVPRVEAGPPPPRCVSIEALARVTTGALAGENVSYVRLPIGWPGEFCDFEHPLDFIGFDGGGGIGSGPGMAVGAGLALRGCGRLPVAVLGDGDFLMGVTALWTAVHYRIPALIVVSNNQSFFNDELHQERVARLRDRPVENRWIGMRMSGPDFDLAKLAEGQGARGFGPIRDEAALAAALAEAIASVKSGEVAVLDVRVAPEYARATSSAVVREMASPRRG